MLTVGKKAPLRIVIENQNGEPVSLQNFTGKWVVLYFYPKDNTPGCTVEAEGFRDQMENLANNGTVVIGVSKDKPASHRKFIEKFNLNFNLWSDTEHALMAAFGTWQEKKFMGRTYMGTTRSTFVIDPEGTIVAVWESVKPLGHAEEVLEIIKSEKLKGKS